MINWLGRIEGEGGALTRNDDHPLDFDFGVN